MAQKMGRIPSNTEVVRKHTVVLTIYIDPLTIGPIT